MRRKRGGGRYSGSACPCEPRRPSACTSLHPVAGQRHWRSFLYFQDFSDFRTRVCACVCICVPAETCQVLVPTLPVFISLRDSSLIRVGGGGGGLAGSVVSGFSCMFGGIQSFQRRELAPCSLPTVHLIPPLSGPRTAAASRSCSSY